METTDPNKHRVAIPKVQKGIDLIAGRKYPIILCECGNEDQRKFVRYIATEFIEDKDRPHRKREINRSHVMCIAKINGKKCGVSIPKIEFDMKAAKLVEESKKKEVAENLPVEKEVTTEKPQLEEPK